MLRRYSVIGNDPSFKQYTKNHDYDTTHYEEKKKQQKTTQAENVLSVSLKDLAQHELAANADPTEEEGGDKVRE